MNTINKIFSSMSSAFYSTKERLVYILLAIWFILYCTINIFFENKANECRTNCFPQQSEYLNGSCWCYSDVDTIKRKR